MIMESEYQDVPLHIPSELQRDEMDWDAYAEHYDVMCELNPSYHHNLQHLTQHVPDWNLSANPRVCDLGAGTGNYIYVLSRLISDASFVHVDFDGRMNELAQKKYLENGVSSVEIIQKNVQTIEFEPESFDLIMCVNALYAIYPQRSVLRKVHTWLKPSGTFFVIDFGRKQRTIDWAVYLFRESMKRKRVGTYMKALIDSREIIKQNRRSTRGQLSGRYWTHSTIEFGNVLKDSGFTVDELTCCYRGYADLAICRK
jgi:ubiquinone/menaquinone biosynthesis C-methylase UbiE